MPINPLASGGRLDAVCGVEYAAQAMAVHGGLTAVPRAAPAAGYLASVRTCLPCRTAGPAAGRSRSDAPPDWPGMRRVRVWLCGAMWTATILEGRAAVVIEAGRRGLHESAPW